MQIHVNGKPHEVPQECRIADLLRLLDLVQGENPEPKTGIAVAVNDEVIPRAAHGERLLQAKDRVEIIHAVGGG